MPIQANAIEGRYYLHIPRERCTSYHTGFVQEAERSEGKSFGPDEVEVAIVLMWKTK